MMKKFVSILLVAMVIISSVVVHGAPGDVAGNIYSTDIVTYMYNAPITSYNIGGKTCIDAEILNWHYGFDVYWYGENRHLDIDDKGEGFVSSQAMNGELIESYSQNAGEIIGQYFETDIVTTLNGGIIESYNIGGRTVICAEAMIDFGYTVIWNPDARTLSISSMNDFYIFEEPVINPPATNTNSYSASYNNSGAQGLYRTPYGEKYHFDPQCGGKNSYEITWEEVYGLDPCSKCTY